MSQTTSPEGYLSGKIARLGRRFSGLRDRIAMARSVKHLHGPSQRFASEDEVTLISLVRDGGYYLDAFFDHYRSLGIRHFVFFDNGSTDDTLDRIRAEPATAILQSTLPWGRYENLFREYAARRYGANGWCLIADMDEIFDFEGRDEIGLEGLITYLDQQGCTAMMAQMLEMFPDASLRDVAQMPYAAALRVFDYCDLSQISRFDYSDPTLELSYYLGQNDVSGADQNAGFLFGGIRAKIFGENCCLSKHPLIKVTSRVTPAVHPHLSTGLRVAPMDAVLKHYKFANDSFGRDLRSQSEGSIDHGEDRKRLQAIEEQPDLNLWSEGAMYYPGLSGLQEAGFLRRSDSYAAFVLEHSNPQRQRHG